MVLDQFESQVATTLLFFTSLSKWTQNLKVVEIRQVHIAFN